MDKNFRVRTAVNTDTVLNVNLKQDFDNLEILSLTLNQADLYRIHSSNYGVIVGRVLANDAFGIPNAKVSIFLEVEGGETQAIRELYNFSEITDTDPEGRRYNLLPNESSDECYKVVGTFPSKRYVLDNGAYLEVYEKYWKYTTTTNAAGDYMIFGVPTGTQQLHVDIDLSDIGVLSQKPRDFVYKGYNITQFDNASQFKDSTNLNSLTQLFTQERGVYVYPFWGDEDNGIAAITRCDVQIQYKFEPTCVFMGAIMSDNSSNSIGHKCQPSRWNGYNNQLVTGEGTIEMIRKTPDGLVEEFQIQGNKLIDGNGVFCYQIPMNLDYMGTDEYGNMVPTDSPSKGIPTRTQVRFRFSKDETGSEGFSRHTAKYLVPFNPMFKDGNDIPTIESGEDFEKGFIFGSATPEYCFRNMYWNKVYSVKNYIPRLQTSAKSTTKNYTGIKAANIVDNQNVIPFNKLKYYLHFNYMLVCIIFSIVTYIVTAVNALLSVLHFLVHEFCLPKLPIVGKICPFKILLEIITFGAFKKISCISLGVGLTDNESVTYFPGCSKKAMKDSDCDNESGKCVKSSSLSSLVDKIQQTLAGEYDIINLDFYNDWLNGALYMPLWYWRKRKKKSYLFGLIKRRAKSEYCDCDKVYNPSKNIFGKTTSKFYMKLIEPCSLPYDDNSLNFSGDINKEKWHTTDTSVGFNRGIIKAVENNDGLTAYYYAPSMPYTEKQTSGDVNKEVKDLKNYPAIMAYATDIILLGSLNENDVDGVPQFFKNLPITTANVPGIATISEPGEETTGATDEDSALAGNDNGETVTTGMDWEDKGNKDNPRYVKGLFMDLSCTKIRSRSKACINVSRLSEYGVNLDMSYESSYSDGNKVLTGKIYPDGMVNKYELDDLENRAMFATMNHIGFIPDAEERHYTIDPKTTYKHHKFKYLYPVDFDGRLKKEAKTYTNNFFQKTYDVRDEAYLEFRMGAGKNDNAAGNQEKKVRRFYSTAKGHKYFPVYNNSFYFYFGINPGNTALDKFNSLFWAQCYQNKKYPFSMSIKSRAAASCMSSAEACSGYSCDCDKDSNTLYPYIAATLSDIQKPYSYVLSNATHVIQAEDNVSLDILGFGVEMTKASNGELQYHYLDGTGSTTSKTDTFYAAYSGNASVLYNHNEETFASAGTYVFGDGQYTLSVTDVNGNTLTEKITLSQKPINADVSVRNLGTKFYDGESTMEDICNSNDFHGKIIVRDVVLDGYVCPLNNVTAITGASGETKFILHYTKTLSDGTICEGQKAQLVLNNTEDCLCSASTVPSYQYRNNQLEINVYKPGIYNLELTQLCNGALNPYNKTIISVNVVNGDIFQAFLNEFPLRFLLGKNEAPSAYNNKFYSSASAATVSATSLSGWFALHNENTYNFAGIDSGNEELWADYVDIEADGEGDVTITSEASKRNIAEYKLNRMFELAAGGYFTDGGTFSFRTQGGVQPSLIRAVAPMYENMSADSVLFDDYALSTDSTISSDENHPNITTFSYDNYSIKLALKKNITDIQNSGARFNPVFAWSAYTGNYFAGFTNYGGWIVNTCDRQENPVVQSTPLGADVFSAECPTTSVTRSIVGFRPVYGTSPYLRTMFVDRRFDYQFFFITPTLEGLQGRLSGAAINGIEMAYDKDDDYNIIGEGLEYTYADGVTTWNSNTKDKRYYNVTFGSFDLTNTFKNPHFSGSSVSGRTGVIQQMNSNTGGSDAYPIVRPIDVVGFPYLPTYSFSQTNCGYNTRVIRDEVSGATVLKAEAGEGAATEFDINCNGNLTYYLELKKTEGEDDTEDGTLTYGTVGHINFSSATLTANSSTVARTIQARTIAPKFRLRGEEEEGHITRTRQPLILKSMMPGVEPIRTIRTETNFTDIENKYLSPGGTYVQGLATANFGDTGLGFDSDRYLRNGAEYVFDDDEDVQKVGYSFSTSDTSGTTRYSILLDRQYIPDDDSKLSRAVRVVYISSPFDGRKISYSAKATKSEDKEYKVVLTINRPPTGDDTYNTQLFESLEGFFLTGQLAVSLYRTGPISIPTVHHTGSLEIDTQDSNKIVCTGTYKIQDGDGDYNEIRFGFFISTLNGLTYKFPFVVKD